MRQTEFSSTSKDICPITVASAK